MAKLERDKKTGSWASRKVIPEDVREAYGKKNEVKRWSAALSSREATAEWRAWLDAVEARIERLRRSKTGEPVTLSHREVVALAGQWYKERVKAHEDNPGDPHGWDAALDDMAPDNPDHEGWKEQAWIVSDIDTLLQNEGLALHSNSRAAVTREAHELAPSLFRLMVRRADGDYRPDKIASALPAWSPPSPAQDVSKSPAVSFMGLFEEYAVNPDKTPKASTMEAWRRMLKVFVAYLGHDDAERITADDIRGWRQSLSDGTRKAVTINGSYLAALLTVLRWGFAEGRLKTNPTEGLTFRYRRDVRQREAGFTDAEAATILKAALSAPPGRNTPHRDRARRWIPWLCAYTGARVGEIAQLRKQDVTRRDGVPLLHITPEAGTVKTNRYRFVPLHSHLIDQGFVEMVAALPDGPIFYDPSNARGGSVESPQADKVGQRLAVWVREIGVNDSRVQPNHGWRHRFKTKGRTAGIPHDALDAIQGHMAGSEGRKYGDHEVALLKAEIEKLPRYQIESD
ncbi:MAG: hypothetical protein ACTHLA_06505 [Asticcacaulis sp.]|uniref:hypothetical protein n=1 Tax=Asticcacaulis sp. TaxID=1872648 RepID=UPI003F7BF8F5